MTYDIKKCDWVSEDKTQTLTGYIPDELINALFQDNINMDLE